MKKRLMIFCDSYLPGCRGGGGMWAVRNLADRFRDRYEFFIVTRDCDGKADNTPYVNIARDKWTERREASVYYASPDQIRAKKFERLVRDVQPDAIYLNSVFSRVCITLLFARRQFPGKEIPVLLAPCGELSEAALNSNRFRKRTYFFFAKVFGLFRGIIWKAASVAEHSEISHFVSADSQIEVAPELTPRDILPDFKADDKPQKCEGSAKLVYLSRITPKKNLHFLLEMLSEVIDGSIELKVIGFPDDDNYFAKCRKIAASLPSNITVEFLGSVENNVALGIVKNCHFMVLPTKNENFGYVVIEALAAGCPVIISDQVEWSGIEESNVGWKIPLDDRNSWISRFNTCVAMTAEDYGAMSFSARQFAVRYLIADEPTAVNQNMFDSLLAV